MNGKLKEAKNQVNQANIFEREELVKKADAIMQNLKAHTWREFETKGKFDKNAKLSFISDEMLIIGCDIGSEMHFARGIDTCGRELSRKAFSFSNTAEGFASARAWMLLLAAANGKKQIVLGLEPTGHYWFCLAVWLVANGISVVQVNPYAVKQTKELEDISQLKDDRKDPKLIANLVKDGAFALELMKAAPFPEELRKLGKEGIREVWHKAKLRGRGYSRAAGNLRYAGQGVGLKEGAATSKEAVRWFAEKILELDVKLEETEADLHGKCKEIPAAENLLEIAGIGWNILSEMGDISRFDSAKEIQKLSGMGLVACSSGKHKGETKISHRGRKRLRYWLFQAAKSAVAHAGNRNPIMMRLRMGPHPHQSQQCPKWQSVR